MPVQRVTTIPTPPYRPADGHKGTFGRVLVIGGSTGMSGAPALAGRAALRSGAGLVTVAVPQALQAVVATCEVSYTTRGLPGDSDGRIAARGLFELESELDQFSSVAIGPGLGCSDELASALRRVWSDWKCPVVIDADGLNLLARQDIADWPAPGGPRVVTPHPGEFARLSRVDAGQIARDREGLAAEFARTTGAVVILKGAGTVVTDGQLLSINPTGNDGLATGGAGDVLTGLMAGLLAQRMPPFEAARLAVYVHGLAADLAAETLSRPGLIASDLPEWIARAWRFWGE
jgi:ADP-dependent NAD(P)H-hydrate dehydratase